LYAIASITLGKDPCKMSYGESIMRGHLLQCLSDFHDNASIITVQL